MGVKRQKAANQHQELNVEVHGPQQRYKKSKILEEELEHTEFRFPEWIMAQNPPYLTCENVLEYFAQSPFWDPHSANANLKMQSQFNKLLRNKSTEELLKKITGLQFMVHPEKSKPPNLFIIQKIDRKNKDDFAILQTYYCINARIYLAPSFYNVMANRTMTSMKHIHTAFNAIYDTVEFHPATGYSYKGQDESLALGNNPMLEIEPKESLQFQNDFMNSMNYAFARTQQKCGLQTNRFGRELSDMSVFEEEEISNLSQTPGEELSETATPETPTTPTTPGRKERKSKKIHRHKKSDETANIKDEISKPKKKKKTLKREKQDDTDLTDDKTPNESSSSSKTPTNPSQETTPRQTSDQTASTTSSVHINVATSLPLQFSSNLVLPQLPQHQISSSHRAQSLNLNFSNNSSIIFGSGQQIQQDPQNQISRNFNEQRQEKMQWEALQFDFIGEHNWDFSTDLSDADAALLASLQLPDSDQMFQNDNKY
ncbi:10043_t:CDS:10 [Ambispora gerdemannii]|uniref:Mediator of RNA polymerase II transcription subunit 6 n=1 Tax=Ambispora gerdemannii TaxID=144530 RepID=A0A9N9FDB6_9GLOM|nr:10043_t:CDS:10 [Ambispora gerdemannii]